MQLIYEQSVPGRRGVKLPKSDVPAAAAVDNVTVVPAMLLIVVPGAMPVPLTYMFATSPAAEATIIVVVPSVFAGVEVSTPLAGLKTTVPVPVVPR